MIDIIPDKKELIKSLRELEFDFEQGNISKRTYYKQKRQLTEKLETMDAADRIRRLQGKQTAEKPLEYWAEKKKEEDELKEREELLKKYVTTSTHQTQRSVAESGTNWSKAVIVGFILVGFIMGTSFGLMLINPVTDTPAVSMVVNDTALSIKNQTNTTSTTSATTSTNYTSYSSSSSNPSYPRNTTS